MIISTSDKPEGGKVEHSLANDANPSSKEPLVQDLIPQRLNTEDNLGGMTHFKFMRMVHSAHKTIRKRHKLSLGIRNLDVS